MAEMEMRAIDSLTGIDMGLDLPVVVVDDDFIEYLEEEGLRPSIDINDFALAWIDWAAENVE